MTTEKKTDVWMPLWIGAYLADTMKLTTLQHGAYLLLLIAYWRERKPLADIDDELRSITKLERAEWKRNRPVLAQFFRVGDGVWWHKRVEAEILAADARSKKAAGKASKAAQARWGDRSKDATGDAPSMPEALPEDVHEECPTPSPTPLPSGDSEANASAAGAAAVAVDNAVKTAAELTKSELWRAGKSLLQQGGMPTAQCGTFVGKLVKDYGDELVIDAVRSAVVAQPADAATYLKATCMRLKGERKDAPPPNTVLEAGLKAHAATQQHLAAHVMTPEEEAAAAAARAAFLAKHKGAKAPEPEGQPQ